MKKHIRINCNSTGMKKGVSLRDSQRSEAESKSISISLLITSRERLLIPRNTEKVLTALLEASQKITELAIPYNKSHNKLNQR